MEQTQLRNLRKLFKIKNVSTTEKIEEWKLNIPEMRKVDLKSIMAPLEPLIKIRYITYYENKGRYMSDKRKWPGYETTKQMRY